MRGGALRIRILSVLVLLAAAVISVTACGTTTEKVAAPPLTVEVNADAAVDFDVIQAAITHVADGGTVKLLPGTYDLADRQLVISKSVRFLGAGAKNTEIVGSAKDAVVSVKGTGDFSAEGISFVKTGSTLGGVLAVDAGQLQLTRCRFTGSSHTKKWSWAAIWVKGHTTGTVRQCVASNGDSGIDVSGSSTITLESNTCSSNRLCGISAYGNARPLIRTNTCAKNGLAGIYAYATSRPQIGSNTCSGNKYGIYITGKSHATIDSNRCSRNDYQGVYLGGSSHCQVSDNRLVSNLDGIMVDERASASVVDNTCRSNHDIGIWVKGHATGKVTGNVCERNGDKDTGGICVSGHGRVTVTGNDCEKNGSYGIFFCEYAGGYVTKNYCSDAEYGILINDNAYPKISGNTCEDNSASNIETYRGG